MGEVTYREIDIATAEESLAKEGITKEDPNYSWHLEQKLANCSTVPVVGQYEGIDPEKAEKDFVPRPDIDD